MRAGGRRRRRPSAVVLALLFGTTAAALALTLYYHLGVPAQVVTFLIGLPSLYAGLAALQDARRPPDPSLAQIADGLAARLRAQWTDEAEVRGLNDPYPLPVAWTAADAPLAGDLDALKELATSGAGWSAPVREHWAKGPEDLAGDGDRKLADVLVTVPAGRLVVLGEPGAGKTTLMLRLVLDLLDRQTKGGPVPILASLASWDPVSQDLHGWLGVTLITSNPDLAEAPPAGSVGNNRFEALLRAGLILPILDGLDEIPESARPMAISRINKELKPDEQLVVTSRTEQYQAAVSPQDGRGAVLRTAAVQLSALDFSKVTSYLRKGAGTAAEGRWDFLDTLSAEAPARQALATPLMAGLARAIYNPRPDEQATDLPRPADLCAFANRSAVEAHLFDEFIPAAYRPTPSNSCRWSAQKAEAWLTILALHLEHNIPGDNLAWWQLHQAMSDHDSDMAGSAAGLIAGLIAGSAAGLALGFAVSPITGLVAGFTAGLIAGRLVAASLGSGSSSDNPSEGVSVRPVTERARGARASASKLALSRVDSFTTRLAESPFGFPFGRSDLALGEPESVHWFWHFARFRFGKQAPQPARGARVDPLRAVVAFALAFSSTLAVRFDFDHYDHTALHGLSLGTWLLAALAAGLAVASISAAKGVPRDHPADAASPRAVLAHDRTAALTLGLAVSLAAGLVVGIEAKLAASFATGFWGGSWGGTILGFFAGGWLAFVIFFGLRVIESQTAWPLYITARAWLALRHRLPWRLMSFLADAHKRGVLRQEGAVYQFQHLELQRRLATRPHDPAIIRLLPASLYPQDVERLARQELQQLLHGTPAEQDLLGLLTTARGGPSGPDLEELADVPLRDIEETMHGWAGAYRAEGWPPSTPEYLLSGYFRLLVTLGDLPHMIACAGDPARHDRMLDLTGGDTAALAEIRTALDLIAAQDKPDLASALSLAHHHYQLIDRNTNIPIGLPAVWAALGQVSRAKALATSIASDPDRQAAALARVAGALARAGQHQQAETLARSITDPAWRAETLAEMAGALARAGQHQQAAAVAAQAETLARSITRPYWQVQALAQVAGALARAGQHQQAEAAACSITHPEQQAIALAQVAEAMARAGQHQQAAAVARQAETAARSVTNLDQQVQAMARVAGALARTGQHQQAAAVAGQAETLARSITHPEQQGMALAQVAGALAEAGQRQQAEAVARSITGPYWQADALAEVAEALAGAGQYQQAETLARSITHPYWQAQALAQVAEALAEAGQHQQAETVARSITHPESQAGALAEVAGALAGAGQHQQAAVVAGQAETLAHSITHPDQQADALAQVARALAGSGQRQQAETLARSITNPDQQAQALAQVAEALAEAGQHQQAETLARSITNPDQQAQALAQVAEALAEAGQHQQAETLARSITNPDQQAQALAQVAEALAEAGQHQQAETLARSITNPDQQAQALAQVAEALAWAGQRRQAEMLASSITNPYSRAEALAQVAGALAEAGQHQRAAAVAEQAETTAHSITNPDQQADALKLVALALAEAGQHRQAETLARSITNPESQAEALKLVAEALARAGQYQQAEALARSITNPESQAEALMQVAAALARTGQHQQAEALARSITNPKSQAEALMQVAAALTETGQHQQAAAAVRKAEAAARSITDPIWQEMALMQVAGALAGTGQHQQAEALARSITNPYWQADALAEVAGALARAGQHQQAETLARSITNPEWQGRALAQVAEALARADDRSALRVTARTCAVGRWTTAARPVLILDPSAFATLARVLADS